MTHSKSYRLSSQIAVACASNSPSFDVTALPANPTGLFWTTAVPSGASVVMCGISAARRGRRCAKEEGVPFRMTLRKSFEGGTPLWLQVTTSQT